MWIVKLAGKNLPPELRRGVKAVSNSSENELWFEGDFKWKYPKKRKSFLRVLRAKQETAILTRIHIYREDDLFFDFKISDFFCKHEVHVKPGETVIAGTKLVVLDNG